jgi:hypothetical protein
MTTSLGRHPCASSGYSFDNLLADSSLSGKCFIESRNSMFTQAVLNLYITTNASKDMSGVDFGRIEPTLNGNGVFQG